MEKTVTIPSTSFQSIIPVNPPQELSQVVIEAEFAAMYLHGPDLIACHVALDSEGEVAGFQWIGRHPKLPDDCVDIATFTRRKLPVRGAGRALFAATLEFARTAGYTQINATIRADNVPGLGYYAKMGFADHAVARDHGRYHL